MSRANILRRLAVAAAGAVVYVAMTSLVLAALLKGAP